jgi:hypothetical protein
MENFTFNAYNVFTKVSHDSTERQYFGTNYGFMYISRINKFIFIVSENLLFIMFSALTRLTGQKKESILQ